MLDLGEIIRIRVARQLGLDTAGKNFSLEESLHQAVWIYGDYGLLARLQTSIRSPVKRLQDKYSLKIPMGQAYRVFHKNIVPHLLGGHQQPGKDDELLQAIPEEGISRQKLAEALEMSIRKLNYRVRKEQNTWQVVKIGDSIYRLDTIVEHQPNLDETILEILYHYPYCTVDHLELFTGRDRTELASPISRLASTEKILRGLTRQEAPDELFCLADQPAAETWEIPDFVLERRDALVEMIKLDRYFTHQDADYWIFVDGIPQAEFDLDKQGRKQIMRVKKLSRFSTTTLELGEILQKITHWGRSMQFEIQTDSVDDLLTRSYRTLGKLLLDRGYTLQEQRMVLDRHQPEGKTDDTRLDQPTSEDRESRKSEILDWKLVGPWAKNRQLLQYDGTTAELVYTLGQLDDITSLAYRLGTNPRHLTFDKVVYIAGINQRMGFVHTSEVEDIIRGWPIQTRYSFLDKKIMGLLDMPKTTDEILVTLADNARTIKQRLRYLESSRSIRKLLPGPLDFDNCSWIRFDKDLPHYSIPVAGKRAMASVGTFLIKALETNPPLTKEQLSRFLGLTIKELEPLLRQYLRTGRIQEGYFLAYITDIQYTLPEVLDTLIATEVDLDEQSAVNRVDILPLSDPYASLHLPPLVLSDPTIQPTQRYGDDAEQWMISWDGIPVGYFIKQPTTQQLLDYELDLKITQKMITSPIIAGALQKIVTLFRTWYGDEGKICTINGTPVSDRKWRDIHFLIESIGIEME